MGYNQAVVLAFANFFYLESKGALNQICLRPVLQPGSALFDCKCLTFKEYSALSSERSALSLWSAFCLEMNSSQHLKDWMLLHFASGLGSDDFK